MYRVCTGASVRTTVPLPSFTRLFVLVSRNATTEYVPSYFYAFVIVTRCEILKFKMVAYFDDRTSGSFGATAATVAKSAITIDTVVSRGRGSNEKLTAFFGSA